MTHAPQQPGIDDRVEVRVLGGLRVRRPDGSPVQPREWRTSKTSDLVLLLALQVGRPVPVDTVLEALWPDAEDARGRASLRTACSQVRHVLGVESLQRRLGGLELCGVWVDASRFRTLVSEVGRRAGAGDAAQAVRGAREADALYVGAVEPKVPGASWIAPDAVALAALHAQACCDAAEAALGLGWVRDAVDFASRALTSDRYSERAFRALMQGLAGLGEVPGALREYERCRALLGDELGVDPSPATRALHLRLLQEGLADAVPAGSGPVPFTGRLRERARLRDVLRDGSCGGGRVVHLVGPVGSGRRRLLDEVRDGVEVRTIALPSSGGCGTATLSPAPGDDGPGAPGDADVQAPLLALVDLSPEQPVTDAAPAVARLLAQQDRPWTLVVVSEDGPSQPWQALAPAAAGAPVVRIEVPPMTEDEVARVAEDVLGGAPTRTLLTELCEQSRRLPGPVVGIARDWLRAGRVVSTADGLTLVAQRQPGTADGAAEHVLADVVRQLQEADLAVVQLLAVLDLPMPAARVVPLVDGGEGPVRAAPDRVLPSLDRLVDLSVLSQTPGGYVFRDPQLQAAVLSWMRPAVRRAVHRRVADEAALPPAHRIGQWLQAGEPERARAVAVASSVAALADGRPEDARALLLRISSLGQLPESTPADRIDTFATLAQACTALGRDEEASAALAVVQRVASAHGLPAPAPVAPTPGRPAHEIAVPAPRGSRPGTGRLPAAPAGTSWQLDGDDDPDDPDLERRLQAAVEAADRAGDREEGARTRLRMTSAVCVPRRQFGLARRWTQEALALTDDSATRAQALVLAWWPGVLLGEAHLAEHALAEAADLARHADHAVLVRRIAVFRRLVAHDLGRPAPAEDAALDVDSDAYAAPLRARAASEGGAALALRLPPAALPEDLPAPVRSLTLLATAVRSAAQGRRDDAVDLLTQVVDHDSRTGHLLLLPEAVARLIPLLCASDLARAHEQFELLDHLTGGAPGHPRENVLRLVARAAVRAAAGQDDAAAAAAAHAAEVASSNGLVRLLAEAQRVRARHLEAAGRRSEARLALAEAARADGSGRTAVLPLLPVQRSSSGADADAPSADVLPLRRSTGR